MFDGKPLIEKELIYCNLMSTWGPHTGNDGGFKIGYAAKGYGFGTLTFIINKDGSLTCDNEREDRETVKYILNCLVDRDKFIDGEEKDELKYNEKHGNANK